MAPNFIKTFDFSYGKPDQLSPLVTRVICENPGPFTFTGSGTYLVGDQTLAIIDPGPDNMNHLEAILTAARGRPISHILLTHTHLDHSGGAAALRQETGAMIAAFDRHPGDPATTPVLEEGGDFELRPDLLLRDGDQIQLDSARLRALHTPGHISNHLCYELVEEKALFTGDHIMGWATSVIIPPDGNMMDYMGSLARLIAREDRIYYPTHGAPIEDPQNFARAIYDHRQERERQILASLKQDPKTIMEIVKQVYVDTPNALHAAAALNVTAHLQPLLDTKAVEKTGDTYRLAM